MGVVAAMVFVLQGCRLDGGSPAPTDSGSAAAPSGVASTVVSVKVNASQYGIGAVIGVTVVNAGSQPVFTEDQKADCTVVILYRRSGSGWTAVSPCGSERAARTVSLGSGEALEASIDTMSTNFAEQPVEPGEYRVTFGFRWQAGPEAGEAARVESSVFTIG
ncbi:hypothetical protein [Rhizocola hellebori]|uniref:hypothetical protein n=1 Tax=Rhizocola hellebori TaxID=1392758 RepID=UPI001943AE3A|nr:hypothetical protein [Rhizocola hellebori]